MAITAQDVGDAEAADAIEPSPSGNNLRGLYAVIAGALSGFGPYVPTATLAASLAKHCQRMACRLRWSWGTDHEPSNYTGAILLLRAVTQR